MVLKLRRCRRFSMITLRTIFKTFQTDVYGTLRKCLFFLFFFTSETVDNRLKTLGWSAIPSSISFSPTNDHKTIFLT